MRVRQLDGDQRYRDLPGSAGVGVDMKKRPKYVIISDIDAPQPDMVAQFVPGNHRRNISSGA